MYDDDARHSKAGMQTDRQTDNDTAMLYTDHTRVYTTRRTFIASRQQTETRRISVRRCYQ